MKQLNSYFFHPFLQAPPAQLILVFNQGLQQTRKIPWKYKFQWWVPHRMNLVREASFLLFKITSREQGEILPSRPLHKNCGFTNVIHEIKPTWSSTSSGTGGYHYPNAGKFFFWILCSLLCWITSTEKYLNITNGMKWWKWSVSHPLTTNHSDIYFWCRWPS